MAMGRGSLLCFGLLALALRSASAGSVSCTGTLFLKVQKAGDQFNVTLTSTGAPNKTVVMDLAKEPKAPSGKSWDDSINSVRVTCMCTMGDCSADYSKVLLRVFAEPQFRMHNGGDNITVACAASADMSSCSGGLAVMPAGWGSRTSAVALLYDMPDYVLPLKKGPTTNDGSPKPSSPKPSPSPKPSSSPKPSPSPKPSSPKPSKPSTPKPSPSPKPSKNGRHLLAGAGPKSSSPKPSLSPKPSSPKASPSPKPSSPKTSHSPKPSSPKPSPSPKPSSPKVSPSPKPSSPKVSPSPKPSSPKPSKSGRRLLAASPKPAAVPSPKHAPKKHGGKASPKPSHKPSPSPKSG